MSNRPVLFLLPNSKWQYRSINATLLALREVVIRRKNQWMLWVRLIYKPPARGHDGRGRAHRDFSPSGFLITAAPHTHTYRHFPCPRSVFDPCVWTGLWRAESHAVSPLSLPNRLWLSEAGAFLQFVPTSLLNHLHYLTVFPQRELQPSVSVSVSLMKACTLRYSLA